MNHKIISACALALAAASAYAAPRCVTPRYVVWVEPDPCLKPLKVECCYDAYREPYRISTPFCRIPMDKLVPTTGNTNTAMQMRREALVRQRQTLQFEKAMRDASPAITQPATGTTIYGSTEGASVVDNPYAPIPTAPPYPGPITSTRVVRIPPLPVGEQAVPVAIIVPSKPGYVYCPFGSSRYLDIRNLAPGSLARDPYSGRIFRVP